MTDYCAFSKEHKCIKWSDYELARYELEEADELCHENWIEIQHQREYIDLLQKTLEQHALPFRKVVLQISGNHATVHLP